MSDKTFLQSAFHITAFAFKEFLIKTLISSVSLTKKFGRMFVHAAKNFKTSIAKLSSTKKTWYTCYSIKMTTVAILCKEQVDSFMCLGHMSSSGYSTLLLRCAAKNIDIKI